MKKNALQPWPKKAWGLPPEHEAAFVCHMADILDTDKKPYDSQYPQGGMDAMSPQVMGEVREPLAIQPGKPLKYDPAYKSNGTATIFMAFEPLTGRRTIRGTDQRTKVDIAVGMPVTRHPLHRSGREELPHPAPTLGT